MRITSITRYKHGGLYEMLQKLGWSQSELARRAKMDPGIVGLIINLVRRPSVEQADAIQRAFGEIGEYMDVTAEWPETFRLQSGFKREQTEDITMERLLDHPEVLQIACPEEENSDYEELLESSMDELPEKTKFLLRERFWKGRTSDDIGADMGCSGRNVTQRQHNALRVLRSKIMWKRKQAIKNESVPRD